MKILIPERERPEEIPQTQEIPEIDIHKEKQEIHHIEGILREIETEETHERQSEHIIKKRDKGIQDDSYKPTVH